MWAADAQIDFLSDNANGVNTFCNVDLNSVEISYACSSGGGGGGGPNTIVGQWVTEPCQVGADNCDGTTDEGCAADADDLFDSLVRWHVPRLPLGQRNQAL